MFHPWKNTAVKGHTSAEDERTVQLVAAKYLRSLDNCKTYKELRDFMVKMPCFRTKGSGAVLGTPAHQYSDYDVELNVGQNGVPPDEAVEALASLYSFQKDHFKATYGTDLSCEVVNRIPGMANVYSFNGVINVDVTVFGSISGFEPRASEEGVVDNSIAFNAVIAVFQEEPHPKAFVVHNVDPKQEWIERMYNRVLTDDLQRFALVFYKSFDGGQLKTVFLVLMIDMAMWIITHARAKFPTRTDVFPVECSTAVLLNVVASLLFQVKVKHFIQWEYTSAADVEQYYANNFTNLGIKSWTDILTAPQTESVRAAMCAPAGFFKRMQYLLLAPQYYPDQMPMHPHTFYRINVTYLRWLVYMAVYGIKLDMPHGSQHLPVTNPALIYLDETSLKNLWDLGQAPAEESALMFGAETNFHLHSNIQKLDCFLYHWFMNRNNPFREAINYAADSKSAFEASAKAIALAGHLEDVANASYDTVDGYKIIRLPAFMGTGSCVFRLIKAIFT